MAFEYKRHDKYSAPVDPKRCKAMVSTGRSTIYQCGRPRWKDGWCTQHHPDKEAERQRTQEKRWKDKRKRLEANQERSAVSLLRELGYTVVAPAGKRLRPLAEP